MGEAVVGDPVGEAVVGEHVVGGLIVQREQPMRLMPGQCSSIFSLNQASNGA